MRLIVPLLAFCLLSGHQLLAQAYADCVTAKEICKKDSYKISKLSGEGKDDTEADMVPCFMNGTKFGIAEENSCWIRFEIAESGWLTFAITPMVSDNDIDFVVYRIPASGNCSEKNIVRCMASGDPNPSSKCMGATGLRKGETDSSEDAGCGDQGDNAWLAPLRAEKGEKYVILVSNVTERGPGFTISFGGSAKLPCDDEKPVAAAPAPKPKPTPPSPEKPPVTPSVIASAPLVSEIEGRKVVVGETMKVNQRKLTISVWDGQVVDGDIISVYLNDKKVANRINLTDKKHTFTLDLPAGKEHLLTVFADDFGKAEPNTAMVEVFDGKNTQTINLVAERTKQQSIKIVLE